jgi:hypothetical protein
LATFGYSMRVLIVAATCAGCTTIRTVRRPVSAGDLQTINRTAHEDPPLRVDYISPLAPGDAAPTQVLSLESVDIAAVNAVGLRGEHLTLDGARVKRVRVVEPGWGAAQGLAGGLATGGLFGLLLAAGDSGNSIIFSEKQNIIFAVVAFGVIGGLVGAIVGGNVGRQTVYVFDDAH